MKLEDIAYSHPDLKQQSVAQTKEELQKTNDVIKATLGMTQYGLLHQVEVLMRQRSKWLTNLT